MERRANRRSGLSFSLAWFSIHLPISRQFTTKTMKYRLIYR
ncbi:hypothetical protein GJA_5155 [Janthinobacterium agaricidamnosum NBRC 102515 = DSM 9628]|uniref:Uncharacterized protein n=1 Tax=Janthinobacterium agaricidamnosum NBRC 102515 = DSM 9628 TaxID=1349767 RepID=W0VEI7_9BURK|nr:hypothetical protein GJA_5155 [Janthinobacterium agaricidamnosum NBRC 102515 = DSM 9628]